ncbi:unnamed protein product [Rhodiola kirilowii]
MQGLIEDEFKDAEFLPPIVSLYEFIKSLHLEPPFENLPPDAITEEKQQQMLGFFPRVMHNPTFALDEANVKRKRWQTEMLLKELFSDDLVKNREDLPIVGLPMYLTKTYEMVEDPVTDEVVSWSRAKNSFIVWDSNKFSTTLLHRYFKHSIFYSFMRQFKTYGLKKVDPDKWEFVSF